MIKYIFSVPAGLSIAVFLAVFLTWLLVYQPTIGESCRIEQMIEEFKAHGCESNHLLHNGVTTESIPMFENHWLLKHLKLERKIFVSITVNRGGNIPRKYLEHPTYYPDLAWIDFSGSNPSDEEFIWAASIPHVQYVNILGEHRISKGFRSLSNRSSYISLSLLQSKTIAADLQNLASVESPFYCSLLLSQCRLDEQCFQSLAKQTSLQNLILTECTGISAQGIEQLKELPLRQLIIRHHLGHTDEFTDDVLKAVSEMPELLLVGIPSDSNVTEQGIDVLKSLPKLSRIYGVSAEKKAEFDEIFQNRRVSEPKE